MVARVATKMVRSANRFSIDILQWDYPLYDRREGGGGGGRRDIVVVMARKRRVKRPCDRIARLSFGLWTSLHLVSLSLQRTTIQWYFYLWQVFGLFRYY